MYCNVSVQQINQFYIPIMFFLSESNRVDNHQTQKTQAAGRQYCGLCGHSNTLIHLAYLQLDCDQLLHHSCISANHRIRIGSARENCNRSKRAAGQVLWRQRGDSHLSCLGLLGLGQRTWNMWRKKKTIDYRPPMPTQQLCSYAKRVGYQKISACVPITLRIA